MRRISAILVLYALASGCAAPLVVDEEGALAIIPARDGESGHIIVTTYVDGHGPYDFLLDTGASISVLFEHTWRDIPVLPSSDETIHVLSMTGVGSFPVASVKHISVGSEVWEGARVALLPDDTLVARRFDGILGIDFLGRYAVWHSPADRSVRLYPRELVAERSYVGWDAIPLYDMRIRGGEVSVLAFDIYIDFERIPTIFDLGATVNLMNRRAARMLGVPVRRPREIPDVWGVTGKTPVMTELHVTWLKVENTLWRRKQFLIGDFPVFEAFEYSTRPLAIAGSSFFKGRDFIIDFAGQRLLVTSRR